MQSLQELPQGPEDVEAIDNERLFGPEIDVYLNLNKCVLLSRIAQKASLKEVHDSDLWRTFASLLKQDEIKALFNMLVKGKPQQNHFLSEHSCSYYDNDLLEALYGNVRFRKAVWLYLEKTMNQRILDYSAALADKTRPVSHVKLHMEELQSMLGISEDEMRILIAIFLQQSGELELGDFSLRFCQDTALLKKIAIISGLSELKISDYLTSNSALRTFNILDEDLEIEHSFMRFLLGISRKPLSERFWTHQDSEALPLEYYGDRLVTHAKLIMDLIEGKQEDRGISILFYGMPGTGKTSLAVTLGRILKKDVFFIAQSSNSCYDTCYSANFRYAALAAAQRQLPSDKCLLVVDECDNMIETAETGYFGEKSTKTDSKGQLNNVIDNNRHIVIWICNSREGSISVSSRRRFDYSVRFDDLLPENRFHIWENNLKLHGCDGVLTQDAITMLSQNYQVNAGGIANAVKNASTVVKVHPERDFSTCLTDFLKAHCELLELENQRKDDFIKPTKDYTLEGLNIHAKLTLEQIIAACRKFLESRERRNIGRDCPRMNILLHGVPGSGKTEFVKYLAAQLKKKLHIMNAANFLSPWVGETEQNIARAFAMTQADSEILFIDEGDSLLSPRTMAMRSWEVTQVNLLLSEMERFTGIFIISTNLIQRLDNAALRRFTFRVHFDFLNDHGKVTFFNTYFSYLGQPPLTLEETNALCRIQKLTPSDFRNVRQQFDYLDENNFTNAKIIDALQEEVQSRDAQNDYKNLGEEKHAIGFDTTA